MCDFTYKYRWPDIYGDLRKGIAENDTDALNRAVAVLEDRDRDLEDTLAACTATTCLTASYWYQYPFLAGLPGGTDSITEGTSFVVPDANYAARAMDEGYLVSTPWWANSAWSATKLTMGFGALYGNDYTNGGAGGAYAYLYVNGSLAETLNVADSTVFDSTTFSLSGAAGDKLHFEVDVGSRSNFDNWLWGLTVQLWGQGPCGGLTMRPSYITPE